MCKICLVSCASSKVSRKSKAKDLYVSSLFQYARKVAERDYDRWYILSALHGLLNPESEVSPYNDTLNTKNPSQREHWAAGVFKELLPKLKRGDEVTFLAGDSYREHLIPQLADAGFACKTPLEGLGLGQQIHTLKLQANN